MTEKEQIEELASNVENALHNHCRMLISCNCNDCEFLKYRNPKTDCQAMCIAKNLYNECYRKLYKDSVVITKEEYEKLKCCENTVKRLSKISPTEAESENKALKEEIDRAENEARKETAEKYICWLKENILSWGVCGNGKIRGNISITLDELEKFSKQFGEFPKQFGLEIKE